MHVIYVYIYIILYIFSVEYSLHLTKILILKKEGIINNFPIGAAPMSR